MKDFRLILINYKILENLKSLVTFIYKKKKMKM